MNLNLSKKIAIVVLFAFLVNTFGPVPLAHADDFVLPAPGVMVRLSPEFNPPILKGIKVHPDNPFRFDFILDRGDGQLSNDALKNDSSKLIKYFLASLTIPEKDLWVNLSPYEKDRIIPNSFGLTEMGRDLLAEDYMLKQITASLIYPEHELGNKFWKRIYEEAAKRFGTTNIPVNTFNKVWIVPEKAVVYENAKAGTAYIVESRLKVMLEQDYLSLQKHEGISSQVSQGKATNQLGSQIVREIVLPELAKEVNENKNFSQLRQVYNSLILATWYKKKIKDSILEQVYVDKNKVAGINIDDPQEELKIYERYLQAFKKGVYNYIKEDVDPLTQQQMPRKYFSGGMELDFAMNTNNNILRSVSDPNVLPNNLTSGVVVQTKIDAAMLRNPERWTIVPKVPAPLPSSGSKKRRIKYGPYGWKEGRNEYGPHQKRDGEKHYVQYISYDEFKSQLENSVQKLNKILEKTKKPYIVLLDTLANKSRYWVYRLIEKKLVRPPDMVVYPGDYGDVTYIEKYKNFVIFDDYIQDGDQMVDTLRRVPPLNNVYLVVPYYTAQAARRMQKFERSQFDDKVIPEGTPMQRPFKIHLLGQELPENYAAYFDHKMPDGIEVNYGGKPINPPYKNFRSAKRFMEEEESIFKTQGGFKPSNSAQLANLDEDKAMKANETENKANAAIGAGDQAMIDEPFTDERVASYGSYHLSYLWEGLKKAEEQGVLAPMNDSTDIFQRFFHGRTVLNIGLENETITGIFTPVNIVTGLRSIGIEAFGVDPNAEDLGQRHIFREGLAEEIPFKDNDFDDVVSVGLYDPGYIERYDYPVYEYIVKEIRRVLKNGGRFMFDPLGDNIRFREALEQQGFEIRSTSSGFLVCINHKFPRDQAMTTDEVLAKLKKQILAVPSDFSMMSSRQMKNLIDAEIQAINVFLQSPELKNAKEGTSQREAYDVLVKVERNLQRIKHPFRWYIYVDLKVILIGCLLGYIGSSLKNEEEHIFFKLIHDLLVLGGFLTAVTGIGALVLTPVEYLRQQLSKKEKIKKINALQSCLIDIRTYAHQLLEKKYIEPELAAKIDQIVLNLLFEYMQEMTFEGFLVKIKSACEEIGKDLKIEEVITVRIKEKWWENTRSPGMIWIPLKFSNSEDAEKEILRKIEYEIPDIDKYRFKVTTGNETNGVLSKNEIIIELIRPDTAMINNDQINAISNRIRGVGKSLMKVKQKMKERLVRAAYPMSVKINNHVFWNVSFHKIMDEFRYRVKEEKSLQNDIQRVLQGNEILPRQRLIKVFSQIVADNGIHFESLKLSDQEFRDILKDAHDFAMDSNLKGGIDLTPANNVLQTQNNGGAIKFHIDPAMLKQLQNAPGFVPVVISVQPLWDLRGFLTGVS